MADSKIRERKTREPKAEPQPEAPARPDRYDPQAIEQKWAARWAADSDLYRAEAPTSARKKYYVLEMLPYPRARCTWGTCATTPSATRWRATCGCRATTCFIPWAGTRSGFPRKTRPSRTRLHRASGRWAISPR